MKSKKQKKEVLKPVDLLLQIFLKELFEKKTWSTDIYKLIDAEITEPNTRYRAKLRIKKLIKLIKEENTNDDLRRYF
jgi:hypothetical protein